MLHNRFIIEAHSANYEGAAHKYQTQRTYVVSVRNCANLPVCVRQKRQMCRMLEKSDSLHHKGSAMARTRTTKSAAPVPTVGSLLGVWVRQTRLQQGMSQRELADAAGLSRSYVCDIERGRGNEPSLNTLDKLAGALGASRSDLMKASGLIDKALIPRESEEERRMLQLFRDISTDGQDEVMRFVRFLHQEEHNLRQASFLPDAPPSSPPAPRPTSQPLALFPLDDHA